jgi:hypothetical protein
MGYDFERSNPMKPCKRAREDNPSDPILPATKHHCRRLQRSSLPTPSPTARASPQSEPKPRKRVRVDRISDSLLSAAKHHHLQPAQTSLPTPIPRALSEPRRSWFLESWLRCQSRLVQEKASTLVVEESSVVPTTEKAEGDDFPTLKGSSAPRPLVSDFQKDIDQMSQDVRTTSAPSSAAYAQSERLDTSSPMYRATLKMNRVLIDDFGTKIPKDVQALVTKHIRKERKSPQLGGDEKDKIIQSVEDIWHSAEPLVSDIITPPLFPRVAPGIKQGRDTMWSTKPLPRSPDYPYGLPAPKTDHHFGFPTSVTSDWTRQELAAADHPGVRAFSQPTRENLFPSFLVEVKSEATGGTLYGAEGQIATAGAHRVNSLIWMIDQVDPSRKRSSADALVFSAAVSQREVIAHVHYYNPDDDYFYMSHIDSFHFTKNIQGCRDHIKNIADWLLGIQQPIVRDALARLHPMTKVWKKGRSASGITDTPDSALASEDGRPTKTSRTSEGAAESAAS